MGTGIILNYLGMGFEGTGVGVEEMEEQMEIIIMENQMKQKIENVMEARVLYRD